MTSNTPDDRSRKVTVACVQMACTWDRPANVDRAEALIRTAAARGAQIIQIQELFETPYFCIDQHAKHFGLASTLEESSTLKRFQVLARSLQVVLPVSWFERAGKAFFNSVAVIDADGAVLGVYRKSHIPNDVGYQEKQYFSPGDTGFRVWQTRYAPCPSSLAIALGLRRRLPRTCSSHFSGVRSSRISTVPRSKKPIRRARRY